MLKTRFKKILTWILSVCMLTVFALPVTVAAGGSEPSLKIGGTDVLENVPADDITVHYWKASESGGYEETVMTEDYLFSVMKTGSSITLTMNDMSITGSTAGIDSIYADLNIILNGQVSIGTAQYGIYCEVGNLSISASGGGSLDITASERGIFTSGGDIEISSGIITINVVGTDYCFGIDSENGQGVAITGGDITVTVISTAGNCIGVYAYCYGMSSGGFSISGGSLKITAISETLYSYGLSSDFGDIDVSGGSLTATAIAGTEWESRGIYKYAGHISISGGSVTATAETATGQSWGIEADNADFMMTGGTVRAEGVYGIRTTLAGSIEGGHFTAIGANTATLGDSGFGIPASSYFYYKLNTEPTVPDPDEYSLGPAEGLNIGSGNKYVDVAYTYAITYDLDGGTNNPGNTGYYLCGTGMTLAEATKDGYVFGGWYAQSDFSGSPVTDIGPTETGDKTLYAKWMLPVYTVTATAGSGGSISPSGDVSVTENGSQTFTIASDNGYEIASVLADGVEQGALTTYTFDNVTSAHTIDALFTPVTYTLVYDLAGGTVSSDNPAAYTVESAGITLINPTKPGYTFAGWSGTGISDNTLSVTIPAGSTGSRSFTASWTAVPVIPSTHTASPKPKFIADVNTENGGTMTLPVAVNNSDGSANVDMGAKQLIPGGTVVTVPSIPGVGIYSVEIPVPELSSETGDKTLTLSTDTGSVTVPSDMLTGVEGINGGKAQIIIREGDKSLMPEDLKAALGDKPLVSLSLSIDGRQTAWSNPDAPVTISIPYKPTAAELDNPESIVVWYIDGSGSVVTVPEGRYDTAAGTVIVNVTHFSDYAVAFNMVRFDDVGESAWYHKAVSFLAAREISTGTSAGQFSPDAGLTRGEFIVLMMRAYGIAPDNSPAPGKKITRQEMFTLLYNSLKIIGQLPQSDSGKTLDQFTDAGQIDSWAKDAMSLFVGAETIGGSGGKLTPTATTTRAEMAQMLYNLLGN